MFELLKAKISGINWDNYKNKNYVLLLIIQFVISCVVGVVLSTVLEFMSISLKQVGNDLFYNYATIASMIAILPGIFSILVGIAIVNYSFKKLSKYIFIITTSISLLFIPFHNINYYLIAGYIFLMLLLMSGLNLSSNKLIYQSLKGRYEDFLSDIMILGGILSVLFYKFAGFMYLKFGYSYVFVATIICFLILFVVGIFLEERISVEKKSENYANFSNIVTKLAYNVSLLFSHKRFIIFFIFTCVMNFFISPFVLLSTTLTYHAKFGTSIYSTGLSISAIAGLLTAVIFKIETVKRINKNITFTHSIFSCAILFASFAFIKMPFTYYVGMLLYGFTQVMCQLSLGAILYNYISNSTKLTGIASFVQGVIVSTLTVTGLLSAGTTNILLKYYISYNHLFIVFGIVIIVLGVISSMFNDNSNKRNHVVCS